ncbi:hypothetical protein CANARDRAFT_30553 [[Candida] arabinofermentans NRRL YB-2248]|uniref:DAGKc domain-containing protein n=1 Tax=[Candida] arabinofermentans NRRL YB-2248 TaxID=983967 RepID=A0A1E4STJ1_9ASCO|nr:hypothetical protein CANARDRAFT_30553 [[Candida] arabinofermentans NRRL YB-2248]
MDQSNTDVSGIDLIFNGTTKISLTESAERFSYESRPLGSTEADLDEQDDTAKGSVSLLTVNELPHWLATRKIHIVDSIRSGNRNVAKDAYNILLRPLLTDLGVEFKYHATTSNTYISSDLIDLINFEVPNLIIFISGDTSISEFIDGVYSHSNIPNFDILISNLPMGTGNAFAHSINHSTCLKSIESLLVSESNQLKLPVYRALFSDGSTLNGSIVEQVHFFIVGSWCLHACLVADSDDDELRAKYGSKRFGIAAERLLVENPIFKGSVKLIGSNGDVVLKPTGSKMGYFVLASVSNFEKTFKISPDSKVYDQSLHLIYFDHLQNTDDTMQIMKEVYDNGSHIKDPRVTYLEMDTDHSIELSFDPEMSSDTRFCRICLDGRIVTVGGDDKKIIFENVYESKGNLFYLS